MIVQAGSCLSGRWLGSRSTRPQPTAPPPSGAPTIAYPFSHAPPVLPVYCCSIHWSCPEPFPNGPKPFCRATRLAAQTPKLTPRCPPGRFVLYLCHTIGSSSQGAFLALVFMWNESVWPLYRARWRARNERRAGRDGQPYSTQATLYYSATS